MSIPTADLRALVAKWREEHVNKSGDPSQCGILRAADELLVLIVKAEAQVGDARVTRSMVLAAAFTLGSCMSGALAREYGADTLEQMAQAVLNAGLERAALGDVLKASPAPLKEGPRNVAVPTQAEQTLERVSDDPLTFRYTATKTEGTL